jgi:hypothetical protein
LTLTDFQPTLTLGCLDLIELGKLALTDGINFWLSVGSKHRVLAEHGVLFALRTAVAVLFHEFELDILGSHAIESLLGKRLQILLQALEWLHRFD